MNYKIYSFDLDGTLARSKTPITPEISNLLKIILDNHNVAIITGGKFSRFLKQVLPFLPEETKLENLILLPTSGGQYYIFKSNNWEKIYSEDLTKDQKEEILNAFNLAFENSGFKPEIVYGDIIEDRGTQITYSALGQKCPVDIKEKWDPDQHKRKEIQRRLRNFLHDYTITIAGTTSIDVTPKFLDKEFGMRKLMEITKTKPDEIIFFGDKLQEGGNDYPVTRTGVKCVGVKNPDETLTILTRAFKE